MAARVYGTVYDNVTKAIISTATVAAPPYTVYNSMGAYYFLTPGAATMNVTASAAGYTPKTTFVTVSNGQLKRVDFYLNPL
jgi:hypothetical protein